MCVRACVGVYTYMYVYMYIYTCFIVLGNMNTWKASKLISVINETCLYA